MITKALRTLVIAAPLSLVAAAPAFAGGAGPSSTYTPYAGALEANVCGWTDEATQDAIDHYTVVYDSVKPNTEIKITAKFKFSNGTTTTEEHTISAADTNNTTGTNGSAAGSKEFDNPAGKVTAIRLKFEFTWHDGSPQTVWLPGELTWTTYAAKCSLTETGSNAAPVGKIALGVTLVGGALAAVAIRRRPRKAGSAA